MYKCATPVKMIQDKMPGPKNKKYNLLHCSAAAETGVELFK